MCCQVSKFYYKKLYVKNLNTKKKKKTEHAHMTVSVIPNPLGNVRLYVYTYVWNASFKAQLLLNEINY